MGQRSDWHTAQPQSLLQVLVLVLEAVAAPDGEGEKVVVAVLVEK